MDQCIECCVRDRDFSKKEVFRCQFCERLFCDRHIEPRLAFIQDFNPKGFPPDIELLYNREHNRQDGHPDFAYSEAKFEEMELEEETRNILMKQALDRMNIAVKSKLRLLGVLGLLSLVIPWEIGFWDASGHSGSLVAWHLLRLGWSDSDFLRSYPFQSGLALSNELWLSFLAIVGFFLVLAGSLLLLQRKGIGGKLLLGSVAVWFIYIVFEFVRVFPYVIIPIGALLCGTAGVASLFYKK